MSTLTNAQLAAKTADEIEKRGLTHGTLADMTAVRGTGLSFGEYTAICPVCSVGGMAAAFYGNPNLGYGSDGNGYDTFVAAVASKLLPGWDTNVWYDGPQEVIYSWNDGRGENFREGKKTTAEAVSFFRSLAAVWSADDALQAATAAGTDVVSTDV